MQSKSLDGEKKMELNSGSLLTHGELDGVRRDMPELNEAPTFVVLISWPPLQSCKKSQFQTVTYSAHYSLPILMFILCLLIMCSPRYREREREIH